MKQKTPMQSLIYKIKSTPIGQINNLNFQDYLKDEKQVIMDARQDGFKSCYIDCESGCGANFKLDGSNETYYNENFNQLSNEQ